MRPAQDLHPDPEGFVLQLAKSPARVRIMAPVVDDYHLEVGVVLERETVQHLLQVLRIVAVCNANRDERERIFGIVPLSRLATLLRGENFHPALLGLGRSFAPDHRNVSTGFRLLHGCGATQHAQYLPLEGFRERLHNPVKIPHRCRSVKPAGNLFAFTSYNLLGRWHEVYDPRFDTFQFVVWHKTNPVPKIRKAGFLNSCELIVCAWNRGHTWNFLGQKAMHNFVEAPICMGSERVADPVHPTQKPLKVLKHLISIASNPGDLVFDPFMGVGSTGVAALELGRRFLGVELDAAYFEAARRRLEAVPEPML